MADIIVKNAHVLTMDPERGDLKNGTVVIEDGKITEIAKETREKAETVIDAKNSPPQGGGEPAIICMGGVIANALFDASGARLFQLPMTPERVLAALNK